MRILRLGLLCSVLPFSEGAIHAQVVTYAFGSTATPTPAATSVAANLSAGIFTGNLGSPATGSGVPVYSAGSGGGYFTASSWTGTAPGANYFEFTLTPDAGHALSLSAISFGYRATGTGPSAFVIRSSADAYGSNLASGSMTNDSSWHATGPLSITLSGQTTSTTLRVYGSGASSSLGTLRVDDLTLTGAVSAIPESSTYAAILGVVVLGGAMLRRRKTPRAA